MPNLLTPALIATPRFGGENVSRKLLPNWRYSLEAIFEWENAFPGQCEGTLGHVRHNGVWNFFFVLLLVSSICTCELKKKIHEIICIC